MSALLLILQINFGFSLGARVKSMSKSIGFRVGAYSIFKDILSYFVFWHNK